MSNRRLTRLLCLFSDCAVFLWQFNASAAVPDLFGEDGGGGDDEEGDGDGAGGHKENWSILRILRGHLQVGSVIQKGF